METEIMLLMVFALVGVLVAFFVGRVMDQTFRVKILRSIFKNKNFIIVGVVGKDGSTVKELVADADGDVIQVGNKIWIIEQGRIYRKDKATDGFYFAETQPLPKDANGKVDITKLSPKKDIVRWVEGVPIVYVDEDHLKPLKWEGQTEPTIKPAQVGATLNSWVINQLAKQLLGMKNNNLMTWVMIGLLCVCVFLIWDTNGKVGNLEKRISGTVETPAIPEGSKVEGDTLVIGKPAGAVPNG